MSVPTVVDDDIALQARGLVNLCEDVLKSVEVAYARAGIALPSRRYWLLGAPVVDCEQLTVSVVQAYIGPPGDEAAVPRRCDEPRTAVLQIQVHRCAPTATKSGRAPAGTSIQAAAETLAIDGMLLLDSAGDLDQWDPRGGPGLGVIATVEFLEPSGAYQGVVLNLTLAVP